MLRTLLSRLRPSTGHLAPIAPDNPFAVVGDIHGRDDLLIRLLEQLNPALPVICVGDYIDRGDNSAEVLRLLHQRQNTICLKGNHEEMMLKFLTNPAKYGPRWLRYGGLQTLASFGISGMSESASEKALSKARNDLFDALGQPLTTWISALPLTWQSGNVVVTHAGADPARAMDLQTDSTLLWGHPDFATTKRKDALWVVHGHTIIDQPVAADGRISVDTGAYATGCLTVAVITHEGVEFIST